MNINGFKLVLKPVLKATYSEGVNKQNNNKNRSRELDFLIPCESFINIKPCTLTYRMQMESQTSSDKVSND